MTTALDVHALDVAARGEIDNGLVACQIAVARNGEVVWTATYGEAAPDDRFLVMSATKPIVSSAAWHLIGDGSLDLERPVADYIPEFAAGGKGAVTVEQVMIMTAGFPSAVMGVADGSDPERRRARFAQWELEYEPGTQYAYHASSAHWVIADLLERITGDDYLNVVEQTVTRPLGLPRVLGIPAAEQGDIVSLRTPDPTIEAMVGDRAQFVEAGTPAGAGVMTASTLVRFYQGLLHNPGALWKPDVLADAITNVRTRLPDPLFNLPANRTLGVVVGPGFGSSWGRSPTAFGWPGAGGQIAFADPATGLSFAFLQHGDTDPIETFSRGYRMSELAIDLG